MTCPRAHCGGLLFQDDGEWVCKSCARRWTDETLKLARQAKPAPAKAMSSIDDAMLNRKLSDLLRNEDDDDEEADTPEEAPAMTRSGWTPERRARFQATMAKRRGDTPKPEARSPKPEARSPKRRGRSPRPTPAGGFDQADGAGRMTSLVEQLRQVQNKLRGQLEKVETAIEAVEGL